MATQSSSKGAVFTATTSFNKPQPQSMKPSSTSIFTSTTQIQPQSIKPTTVDSPAVPASVSRKLDTVLIYLLLIPLRCRTCSKPDLVALITCVPATRYAASVESAFKVSKNLYPYYTCLPTPIS